MTKVNAKYLLIPGLVVVVLAAVASVLARATPTARAVAGQTADQPSEREAAVV
jgi:hypothetical protein